MIVYKLKDGKCYDKKQIDEWIERSGVTVSFEEVDIPVDEDITDAKFEDFVDGAFSREVYEKRKQFEYEAYVESLIHERYTIGRELAILRQRDEKPEEFAEYNAFAEECKLMAKKQFGRE